jgi:hypothetical protein
MPTLVLRIRSLNAAQTGYPLELFELADDTGALTPAAQDLMPPLPNPGDNSASFGAEQMIARFADASTATPALEAIGDQLYAAIAQPAIAPKLAALLAPNEPAALALAIDDASLRRLPWELMRTNRIRLATRTPIYRVVPDWAAEQLRTLPPHSWPLRVLVVVAAGQATGPQPAGGHGDALDVAAELDGMCDAMIPCEADLDLQLLQRPSIEEVRTAVKDFRPHVLHFIGHGGREPAGGRRPYLVLQTGGGSETWYEDDIRNDFLINPNDPEGLRLVVLNACRTDGRPAEERAPISLSETLAEVGAPAVIGMSCDIADTSAAIFSRALYGELARRGLDGLGGSVEQALLEARRRVQGSERDGARFREWAAPVLLVAAQPSGVVRMGLSAKAPGAFRRELDDDAQLRLVRCLVGRREDRYRRWKGLQQRERKVLTLVGQKGIGKTEFVRMLMQRCALQNHTVRYIDAARGRLGPPDFLDLLLAIRGGDPTDGSLLCKGLPAQHFAAFWDELVRWFGAGLDLSQPEQLRLKPEHRSLDEAAKIFAAFKKGLEGVAEEAPPLVLVIDHLQVPPSEFINLIHPLLLEPCSASKQIVFVLLLESSQAAGVNTYELDKRGGVYELVEVPEFPPGSWSLLAWEYVRRNLDRLRPLDPPLDIREEAKALIARAQPLVTGRWQPARLLAIVQLLGGFKE